MPSFKEKIAVITGAAGALGSTVASQFAEAGAHTILIDLDKEGVSSVSQQIDGSTQFYACDLTDESQVKNLVDQILDEHDRIDILANIAGGFTMGDKIHETDHDTLEFMLDLNVRTTFTMSKYVLKSMLKQETGKIINIGARAGLEGSPTMGPYVGAKSMVIRLTETMAKEYRDHNINVNCILPGTIDTEQNRKDMPNADFDTWVKPSELGNVIMFLASDEASGIKGAAIPVYGNTL